MRMKLTTLLLFCAGILTAGQHLCEVSGPAKNAGALEIVTEQPVPVVKFAAKELQTYLKQATGQNIPVVKKATAGKTSIFLGDCPSARAAGLDVSKLPDEGFRILRKGNRVFIAGRDDPKQNPEVWRQYFRRATLSAVYDFLERFADARFFFPGPHGTVVPLKKGLFLPEKIDITESPDMVQRSFYFGTSQYIGAPRPYEKFTCTQLHPLQCQRLRLSENKTDFSHGLTHMNFIGRFAKSHPEYFALRDDGRRHCDPKMIFPGQLCFTSGIREVIFQDAKAYFTGRPASERGMKSWNFTFAEGKYYCLSPQDMMYWCRCENCRKICDPKKANTLEGKKLISNFMFAFFAEVAERLTKEGIDGTIAVSIYPPCDQVPDCPLPKNLLLKICVNGLVDKNRPDTDKMIRDWGKKVGARLQSWTYSMGKHMSKEIPNLPQMMPRAAAQFISTYRDCLAGVFWEAETDIYLFNYLNAYIAAKMMWNNSLDADKLLDDHYRSMFGKGAPMVKEVFEDIERCWVNEIISKTTMGSLGPGVTVPGDWKLWMVIYSPEKMARFRKLFEQAKQVSADDPAAAERIQFIWKEVVEPLYREQQKFQQSQYSPASWRVYAPGSVYLRPAKGEINEVNTRVDVVRENDSLVFRFDCEEPLMNELKAGKAGRDNPAIRNDSSVEILINPSGDRKNFCQFIVNAAGALADFRCEAGKKPDLAWNSSASVKTGRRADGWTAEVRIPLKDLGPLAKDVPVNFVRHRILNGKAPAEIDYQWSPQPKVSPGGFLALDIWGTLSLEKVPEKLIPNGDFSGLKTAAENYQEWRKPVLGKDQICRLDKRTFISGGQSLYFKNSSEKSLAAYFMVPGIKPKTRYRLSYYVKTKDIKAKGRGGAGVTVSFLDMRRRGSNSLPYTRLTGTAPWHRLTFEFTTPDPLYGTKAGPPKVGLSFWSATGEVWFDKVEIEELK